MHEASKRDGSFKASEGAAGAPERMAVELPNPDEVSVEEGIESITRAELDELKAYRKPPASVVSIIGAVSVVSYDRLAMGS